MINVHVYTFESIYIRLLKEKSTQEYAKPDTDFSSRKRKVTFQT